jgi:WD40 repeat protein
MRTGTFCRPRSLLWSLGMLLMLGGCGGEQPFASTEVAAKGLFSAALSSDGRRALIGSLSHGGSLWNLDDNERLFDWNHRAGSYTPITVVAISPEGAYGLTVEDESLVLWNALNGEALRYFTAPSQVLAADLGPDGRYALLGMADNSAVLFDAQHGGIKRVLRHEGRVRSVALNRTATLALTGAEDRTARLWDLESGRELHTWQHDADVRLVALAPDGSRALSVSKYDRAALWDAASGAEIGEIPTFSSRTIRGETFTAAAFSPDASELLTGTTDREVQLWQLPELEEKASWVLPRRAQWKRSGAYVLAVGYTAQPEVYLGVSADGFIHRLRSGPR